MESLILLLLSLAQLKLDQAPQAARASHMQRMERPHRQAPLLAPVSVPNIGIVTPSPAPATQVQQQPTQQQTQQTLPVQTTPSPSPAPVASDFRSEVEQYVLAETNAARTQKGLPALTSDSRVASVARAHSQDMLTKNYFAHTNLLGCDPGCRLTNGGYVWRSYGENIHWMSGYNLSAQDTGRKIVNDWLNSPPHYANIMGAFTYAGVGIAVEGSKIYSTTVYTTK